MDSRVTCLIDGIWAPITAESGVRLQVVSTGQGWGGVHLELGVARGKVGGSLLVGGHMVSMNPGNAPIPVYLRDEGGGDWVQHSLLPGMFMIHPEGGPLWMISPEPTTWSAAIISSAFLDNISGGHRELGTAINVDDPVLRHLFWALIEEAGHPSTEETVTRSLVSSFGVALGCRLGQKVRPSALDGLKPTQLSRLDAWVARNIGCRITVGDMAEETGLSATQFTRKFRQSTGRSPWEYVIERRLCRAKDMLDFGESISATAAECGFVDQAHLSRLFKRRFEISPAAYARARKH